MAYMLVVDRGPSTSARGEKRGAWTIAEYLTAYGIAVIAPILLFSGLLLHHYNSIGHSQLEQEALQVARAVTADIDRELGVMVATVEAVALYPELESGDYASFHKHAKAVADLHPDQRFILSDAAGMRLLDTSVAWSGPLATSESVPQGNQRAVPGQTHVSDMAQNTNTFSIRSPIPKGQLKGGVLSLEVGPDRLAELLTAPNIPAGWQARVVDRRGYTVTEPEPGRTVWGDSPNASTVREDVVWLAVDGQEKLKAFNRAVTTGWRVEVMPTPGFMRPEFLSWRVLAAGGLGLLILSMMLAIYFGRRLASPIQISALAASAFRRGEAVPNLGVRLREVDEVLNALKTASRQRALAEDQLRAAHERTMLALSANDMGMWEQDVVTGKVTWTDAMYRIFDRTRDEFSGTTDDVLSYVFPADRAQFNKVVTDAISGGVDTFEHEARIVQPSGEVRWLQRRAFVRRGTGGQAVSVLGVALDVTQRRESENANAELAAIVGSSSEAILSVSPEGVISTWNTGAKQMFGLEGSEAVGMSLQSLFAVDKLGDWHRLRSAMHGCESVRLETLCQSRGPRPMEVLIVANPVHGPVTRDVSRYSVTIRDISERKEHDRHLAGVMRELTHRSKNLLAVIQAMARQTALRSDSLGDFENRFSGRLQSLSRSHELLIGNDWEGATLIDLVAVQRTSFGPRHARIRASGPDVFLQPEAILNIGLALHELASNAERHGGLASPNGRVELNWRVDKSPAGAPMLAITWREFGKKSAGDMLHKGFGRDILEHVAPTALGGKAVLKSVPDGLLWTIEIPFDQFASARRRSVA